MEQIIFFNMAKNMTIEERESMRGDVNSIIVLLKKVLESAKSLSTIARIFFPKYSSFISKIEEAIAKLEKIIYTY